MKHREGEVPVATNQILKVIFRLGFAGADLSAGRGNMDLDAGERVKRAMARCRLPKTGREGRGDTRKPFLPKKNPHPPTLSWAEANGWSAGPGGR